MNSETKPFPWSALVAAGLACGVLDINAAFANTYLANGRTPLWVLRAVAAAVLGRDAFSGGAWVPGLGLLMHFSVAFSWAAAFVVLSRKFPVLIRQAVPAGMVFGAGVYLFMNFVTLPFCSWFRSLYLHTPVNWTHAPLAWPQFLIHLTCVGLAISLSVKKFTRTA